MGKVKNVVTSPLRGVRNLFLAAGVFATVSALENYNNFFTDTFKDLSRGTADTIAGNPPESLQRRLAQVADATSGLTNLAADVLPINDIAKVI